LTTQFEKEFLIVGIVAGAFIALFYDLLQELIALIIPTVSTALIKTLASFLAILIGLLVLKRYLKSIKKCKDDENPKKLDMITNNKSKNKFRKFLESERNNMFILLGAGGALTISTTSTEFSFRFVSGLIASGLFIFAIFRRARANYGIQTQIDKLRNDIDELKRNSKSDDNSKSDNRSQQKRS
jgi:hypothetical protein